jgi:5'-3' exonuclease, N-terminal resolvase-like domain
MAEIQKFQFAWQGKKVVMVDLSWIMHRGLHRYKDMRVLSKSKALIPTGHIYGSIMDVMEIAYVNSDSIVVLALESMTERKKKLASYKGQRDRSGYNIYNDLVGIVNLLTSIDNVYYAKEDWQEADDIISSVVNMGVEPLIFGNDIDLLVTPKKFTYAQRTNKGSNELVDVAKYIGEHKKYGGIRLGWLPLWWLVVRGKSSNNIKASVPRFNGQLLRKLCIALRGTQDFPAFKRYVRVRKSFHKIYDRVDFCRENYELVLPVYKDLEVVKKSGSTYLERSQFITDKRMQEAVRHTGLFL